MTCRPSPVRLPETISPRRDRFRRCATTLLVLLAAAGVSSVSAGADPGKIAAKRAEVRQVLALQKIDYAVRSARGELRSWERPWDIEP